MIITDLGQRQKSALNAVNTIDLSKPLQMLFYVLHNLESQNAGLVDVKNGIY